MSDYGPKDMKKIRKNRRRNIKSYTNPTSVFYVGGYIGLALRYGVPYWLNPPYVDPCNGRITKQWRKSVYLFMN